MRNLRSGAAARARDLLVDDGAVPLHVAQFAEAAVEVILTYKDS